MRIAKTEQQPNLTWRPIIFLTLKYYYINPQLDKLWFSWYKPQQYIYL